MFNQLFLFFSDEIKKQVMNSNAKLIFTLPELWSTVSGSVKSAGNIPIVVVKHKVVQRPTFPLLKPDISE